MPEHALILRAFGTMCFEHTSVVLSGTHTPRGLLYSATSTCLVPSDVKITSAQSPEHATELTVYELPSRSGLMTRLKTSMVHLVGVLVDWGARTKTDVG